MQISTSSLLMEAQAQLHRGQRLSLVFALKMWPRCCALQYSISFPFLFFAVAVDLLGSNCDSETADSSVNSTVNWSWRFTIFLLSVYSHEREMSSRLTMTSHWLEQKLSTVSAPDSSLFQTSEPNEPTTTIGEGEKSSRQCCGSSISNDVTVNPFSASVSVSLPFPLNIFHRAFLPNP